MNVPKTLVFPASQIEALERIAEQNATQGYWTRTTWADLVRQAVAEFIGRNRPPAPKKRKAKR